MLSLETLCEERTSPLLVGCVKSNLGHTEATSGLCSIAKIIIAMETGLIPPNLHYYTPQNGIEVLQQDKIRVKFIYTNIQLNIIKIIGIYNVFLCLLIICTKLIVKLNKINIINDKINCNTKNYNIFNLFYIQNRK